jgi:hypothetical protein
MCKVFRAKLQFKKGFRGTDAVWTGTRMELKLAEEVLVLSIPHKMMAEVTKVLNGWHNKGMVPLREVRAITGLVGFVASSHERGGA